MEAAALFLAAFGAEVVGTVAGFGSSTVFLPLALLFVDFRTALVLVAFLHIFGNLGRVWFFWRGLDGKMLIKFGIPSVFLALLGAALVSVVPVDLLKGALGVFLVGYALVSLWKEDVKIKPTFLTTVIGGGVSGFLAGLLGTGGALRGAFLMGFGLPKERYVATAAAVALAVDMTRIPVYLAYGFLERRFYEYVPVLLVIALVGSWAGKEIVDWIPQRRFRRAVLVAILIAGGKFVFRF